MYRHAYTTEELEFIIDNYKNCDYHQLTVMFNGYFDTNVSESSIRNRISKLEIAKRKLAKNYGKYSQEMIDYLLSNYNTMTVEQLALQFNKKFNVQFTASAIWHKIDRYLTGGIQRNTDKVIPRVRYSAEMNQWLLDNYKHYTNQLLTAKLNEIFNVRATVSAIEHKLSRLGIKHTADEIKSNYGKYRRRASELRFKKGQPSVRRKPIGYERHTKEGYIMVKVTEPNVFEAKHRYIWQQHYGKIPEGCMIIFVNGDKNDYRIENLACVSRSDNCYINKLGIANTGHRDDIGNVKIAMAKLVKKRSELKNGGKKYNS